MITCNIKTIRIITQSSFRAVLLKHVSSLSGRALEGKLVYITCLAWNSDKYGDHMHKNRYISNI